MQKSPITFSSPGLFTTGIGQLVIARFKGGGRVELGVFLLDVYCLGVKNAFYSKCTDAELDGLLERFFAGEGEIEKHSGAWGRKLVEGAVNYARQLGFAPHRDYKMAARVMGGIDPKSCPDRFVFGQNGKPLFVAGPHEDEARCQLIMNVLTRKCGVGGFDYLIPIRDPGDISDEESFGDEEEGGEK